MKSKRIYSLLLVAMFVSMGTTTAHATTSKVSCSNTNKSIVTSVNKSNVSTWTKNTKYYVGDKVSYNGNIYECTVDHSRLLPTTTYVWKLISNPSIPEWTKNTRYCVGDKVSYNGNTYECIIDHSRLLPTTTYVWKLL